MSKRAELEANLKRVHNFINTINPNDPIFADASKLAFEFEEKLEKDKAKEEFFLKLILKLGGDPRDWLKFIKDAI